MNKKSIGIIVAFGVLVVAILSVAYLLYTEKQTNKELVQEFSLEKGRS